MVRKNTQAEIANVYTEHRIAADIESRRVQSFEFFVRFNAAMITKGANGIAQKVAMLKNARIFATEL